MYDIDDYTGDTVRERIADILSTEGLPETPEGLTVICEGVTFSPHAVAGQRPVHWEVVDRGHRSFLGVRLEDHEGYHQSLVFEGAVDTPAPTETPETSWRDGLSLAEIDAIVEADEASE